MQTFITDFDMAQNAKNLDNKRLGKQRVEAIQILNCLLIKESRWKCHPAVKMWKGYEGFLIMDYLPAIMYEWEKRGFKNEKCLLKWRYFLLLTTNFKTERFQKPLWITDEFIESHRSNLIRKLPEHYKPLFPTTKENLPYIWPV